MKDDAPGLPTAQNDTQTDDAKTLPKDCDESRNLPEKNKDEDDKSVAFNRLLGNPGNME